MAEPESPAFQVIVLGPNGGPREDHVTGLLVRSTSMNWVPGSVVAVDAGTLLAGIIRILKNFLPDAIDEQKRMTEGPFKGLQLPAKSAEANAAHIFREIIGAVLITHPHLDHISGLAINTPILEAGSGPKPVAALPSVLSAIKNHMFNDIIWPNLSDEDGGAGLLTYQRLVEGGNTRFGMGDTRGYVRACNGLLTKCLSVSHGHSKQRFHPESGIHHRVGSTIFPPDQYMLSSRAVSMDQTDGSFYSPARSPHMPPSVSGPKESMMASVESSAFFIRDHHTGREIIIFGDLEPDSVSLEPRNKRVWEAAAPKVHMGRLGAIFMECSFSDSIDDSYLYGHLCPRHVAAELSVLAAKVMELRDPASHDKKRKRPASGFGDNTGSPLSPRTKSRSNPSFERSEPRSGDVRALDLPDTLVDRIDSKDFAGVSDTASWENADPLPLTGLSVYIIHIKEGLDDGPPPEEQILKELRAHAEEAHLGCQFFIPDPNQGIWV
ncbi:hypothetical protein N7539_002875 [Penicillium diatomitis]|uniref:Uncharacterized protein n=1 Tax=Penicillium diatomitis TaxID=2819901 RepID=A0A9X0BZH7_9EURO|nr:uncharacterized protein N7539_002875 [Penicillium diatomitis]KAJ5491308.1 hypothetical protein N7539_002875 [Penicillium diatomitis]